MKLNWKFDFQYIFVIDHKGSRLSFINFRIKKYIRTFVLKRVNPVFVSSKKKFIGCIFEFSSADGSIILSLLRERKRERGKLTVAFLLYFEKKISSNFYFPFVKTVYSRIFLFFNTSHSSYSSTIYIVSSLFYLPTFSRFSRELWLFFSDESWKMRRRQCNFADNREIELRPRAVLYVYATGMPNDRRLYTPAICDWYDSLKR